MIYIILANAEFRSSFNICLVLFQIILKTIQIFYSAFSVTRDELDQLLKMQAYTRNFVTETSTV